MRYEFEYQDVQEEWRPFGTGEEETFGDALVDAAGGELPEIRRYRSRPMDGQTDTWTVFWLSDEAIFLEE